MVRDSFLDVVLCPHKYIDHTPMSLPPPAYLYPSTLPSTSSSLSPPPIWTARDRRLSQSPSTPSSELLAPSKPSPFDSHTFFPLERRHSPSMDFSRLSLVSPVLPASLEGGSGVEELAERLTGPLSDALEQMPQPAQEQSPTSHRSRTPSPPLQPPPPPPPSPPKVKLSLKDFAMRKKRQREEEEIAKSVKAQNYQANGMDIDVQSTESIDGAGVLISEEKTDDSGVPVPVNDMRSEEPQLPNACLRLKHPPSSSLSPCSHGRVDSLQAKMEIVENAITSEGERSMPSSCTPFPPPSGTDGSDRERHGEGVVTTVSDCNSSGTSREDGEIPSRRTSPKIFPANSFVPRSHTPPTQPRSFGTGGSTGFPSQMTPAYPRRTVQDVPSTTPMLTSSGRPLPSAPRALRAMSQASTGRTIPTSIPSSFIPRGPSADRERERDRDRDRAWPAGRGRGGGSWRR
jgi:hypothetical protein